EVDNLSLINLIENGGFENGSLNPWISLNAEITSEFSHSDYFSVKLTDEQSVAFIGQFIPVQEGEQYEFFASLAKVGTLQSPMISISVVYYDDSLNLLGYGLIKNFSTNTLPNAEDNQWI